MRGKWTGYCGAHIGPDPDQLGMWQICCSTTSPTLETCHFVPCNIGGQVSCELAEQCVPNGGTPLVFACNHKGTPRADGSCECERNEDAGTGYTSDDEAFSEPNCFKTIVCPISDTSQTPCNALETCSEPENWLLPPNIDYYNQQVDLLLVRLGYDYSNASVIRAVSDITEIENTRLQAYVKIAIAVQEAIAAVRFGICILSPNDTNSSFPQGMVPYVGAENVILPYQKSYESPFIIRDTSLANTILQNDIIVAVEDLNNLNETADFLIFYPSVNYTVLFNSSQFSEVSITAIRIHARNSSNASGTIIDFGTACPPVSAIDSGWAWFEQYCTPIYTNYDYYAILGEETVNAFCSPAPNSSLCIQFRRDNCPGKFLPINELHEIPRGCTSDCCILVSGSVELPISSITITVSEILLVDEVQFYGFYSETVKPVPPKLFTDNSIACTERPDYRYAQLLLGDDKSYFSIGTESKNYTDASLACQERGGWLATTISNVDAAFNIGLQKSCNGVTGSDRKCFIGLQDGGFSRGVKNITYFFESSCTAFGCYFSTANTELDLYAARNESIYDTKWGGTDQKTWSQVLPLIQARADAFYVQFILCEHPCSVCSCGGAPCYYVYDQIKFINGKQTTVQVTAPVNPNCVRPLLSYQQACATLPRVADPGQWLNGYRVHGELSFRQSIRQHNLCLDQEYLFGSSNYIWKQDGYEGVPEITVNFHHEQIDAVGNIIQTTGDIQSPNQIHHTINPRRRRIRFLSFSDIANLDGVQDGVTTLGGCLVTSYYSWGYCGKYLWEAFPYDHLGIDMLEEKDYRGTVTIDGGGTQTSSFKFNDRNHYLDPFPPISTPLGAYLSKRIRGNGKSFVVTFTNIGGVWVNYTISLDSNPSTIVHLNVTINTTINNWVNIPSGYSLNSFRVYPAGVLNKYKVIIKGESFDNNTAREETMGYITHPYMGQNVYKRITYRIGPGYSVESKLHSPEVNFYETFEATRISHTVLTTDYVEDELINGGPSVYIPTGPAFSEAFLISTESLGRLIRPCEQCEVKHRSFWNWVVHTYTRQGGFPKQATAPDSGILVISES
jgi:hypothetical protein